MQTNGIQQKTQNQAHTPLAIQSLIKELKTTAGKKRQPLQQTVLEKLAVHKQNNEHGMNPVLNISQTVLK